MRKIFNSIKHHKENRIKMAFVELVKKFKSSKQENKALTAEEKEKVEKMKKIKGDVKVLSPDYKQRHRE
jgi:hypothetical protein